MPKRFFYIQMICYIGFERDWTKRKERPKKALFVTTRTFFEHFR